MAETENPRQDLTWVFIVAACALVIKFQDQIMEFLNAFIVVVGSILAIAACVFIGWRVWLWRKARKEWKKEQIVDIEPLLLEYHPTKKKKSTKVEGVTSNVSLVPPKRKRPVKESDEVRLLNRQLYHIKEVSRKEQDILRFHHYRLREFVPMGKTRREQYFIKEGKNYMLDYTFLMHHTAQLLQGRVENIETHRHELPTITFTYKGQKCAIEVVTDRLVDRKTNRLSLKKHRNDRAYGIYWWFVVSRSAYAKFFYEWGQVVTRNKFMDFLDKQFPPISPSS